MEWKDVSLTVETHVIWVLEVFFSVVFFIIWVSFLICDSITLTLLFYTFIGRR